MFFVHMKALDKKEMKDGTICHLYMCCSGYKSMTEGFKIVPHSRLMIPRKNHVTQRCSSFAFHDTYWNAIP